MYKILSIDGGGIKGVFPAAFLAEIEKHIPGKIADYFDLIAGTSTGGIIALALGLGLSAEETVSFYEKYGPEIFKTRLLDRVCRKVPLLNQVYPIRHSLYPQERLKNALQETFSNHILGDSKTRLLIPTLSLEIGDAYLFKTYHNKRFVNDYKMEMVEVAMATAAAPTYFNIYKAKNHVSYIDGGVWSNNPTDKAVIEALHVLGWPKEEIQVLSLGCTKTALDCINSNPKGKLQWVGSLVDIFHAGQSSAALGTATILLGNQNNLVRIDPIVAKGRFELDSAEKISALKGLGYSEARKELSCLQSLFFNEPAQSFQPHNEPSKHEQVV